MWDSAGARGWDQPPAQNPALDLSSSCLTGKLQRVNPSAAPLALCSELLFPSAWAYLSLGSHPQLVLLALAAASTAFPRPTDMHRAGGALMPVTVPLPGTALTPCAGRMHVGDSNVLALVGGVFMDLHQGKPAGWSNPAVHVPQMTLFYPVIPPSRTHQLIKQGLSKSGIWYHNSLLQAREMWLSEFERWYTEWRIKEKSKPQESYRGFSAMVHLTY